MGVTIIGIDCAVDEKNIGVAIGEYSNGSCTITKLPVRKQGESIAQMVTGAFKISQEFLNENLGTSLRKWSRGLIGVRVRNV